MKLAFHIPGKPRGKKSVKARAFWSDKAGKYIASTYTENSCERQMNDICMIARDAAYRKGWKFAHEAVLVTLEIICPIPMSWSKKKRAAAAGRLATCKPDVDNIKKLVFDGITRAGNVWRDDKQVAAGSWLKRYATLEEDAAGKWGTLVEIELALRVSAGADHA